MHETDNKNDEQYDSEEQIIDDDALELAAGGLVSPPSDSGGYTYNATIYFQ